MKAVNTNIYGLGLTLPGIESESIVSVANALSTWPLIGCKGQRKLLFDS